MNSIKNNIKSYKDIILNVAFIYMIALLIFRFISSFFPEARLWGLNHAGYIDGMIIIYPIFIAIGFFIYFKAKKINDIFYINENKYLYKIIPWLIIITSGFCYYIFSVDSYFMGDGYPILSIIQMTNVGFKKLEAGEMFIHHLLLILLGGFNEENAIKSYQLISIASGIVFISSIVYYGKKITKDAFSYLIFILLNIFSAFTAIYYGYVEHYSIVSVFIYLFILSSIYSLKISKKSLMPIIFFIVAFLLHKISIVYLPGLILYLLIVFFKKNKFFKFILFKVKYFSLILIILFAIFYILILLYGPLFWQTSFLHPFDWQFTIDNYNLFSLNHILEYLNLVIFVIPIPLFFIIVLLLRINTNNKDELINKFLISISIIGILASFIFEPKLGMARDWDLISVLLLGTNISAFYFWVAHFNKYKLYNIVSILLILINISIIAPWLSLLNSETGLYKYNMDISCLDMKHGRLGIWNALVCLDKNNYREKYVKLYKYNYENYPEYNLNKKGIAFRKQNDFTNAMECFNKAIKENPQFKGSYLNKSSLLFSMRKYEKALELIRIADGLSPGSNRVEYMMGTNYAALHQYEEGLKHLHKSIYYDSNYPEPYLSLGHYYYNTGKLDSSLYYYTCLPDSVFPSVIYYHLGLTQLALNNNRKAFENFKKYLNVGNNKQFIAEINKIMENNYQTKEQ